MADLSTTYDENGVTTRTQQMAVPKVNDDMSFFRDMATRALTPQRAPRRAAAESNGPGMWTQPLASHAPARRWGAEHTAENIGLKNAKAEAGYQQQLRDFDINGPKKKNMFGWGPMVGGFVEDRDSIPYSLRGKIDFANSPGESAQELPLRQAAGAADFARFAGTNKPPVEDDGQRADFYGFNQRRR